MDFKIAKLDWQDILKDWISWIYYVNKEWRRLSSDDYSQNIDWVHGRDVSPTFARVRIITLEWFVDRLWNDHELEAVQYLQNLFALQADLSSLQNRVLYIKDMYDAEWKLNVKVKDPLEFIEWDENFLGSHWKWRVVLESTSSPIYKSFEDIIVNWTESSFGWFELDFELWVSFDSAYNIIECTTSWNTSSPAKITITATWSINSIFKIINITNNTFFWLDISATSWDIIIIDSNTKTATKNGVNILANRIEWSSWQNITWTTQFIIEDQEGGLFNSDFNVSVLFNNSLF